MSLSSDPKPNVPSDAAHEASAHAACGAFPQYKSYINKAVKAGIPWATILLWVSTYGPQLATIIEDLIAGLVPAAPNNGTVPVTP